MNVSKAIIERRSIRRFTDKKISDDIIKDILKSAMYAPSGGNAQPWDFVIVDDLEKIKELEKTSPYAMPLRTAPLAIVVCGNMEKSIFEGLWVQDCSAATQNILLEAHSKGIGTTWLGVHPDPNRVDATKKIINAPEHIIPLSIIALGYPDEAKDVPSRFKEENIHMNSW